MPTTRRAPTVTVPIVAQDPTVTNRDGTLLGDVDILSEKWAPGPRGARVHVVDYDASTRRMFKAAPHPFESAQSLKAYRQSLADPRELVRRPELHAINAYATVMKTLSRFEFALGRRISWSFGGHQIHVVPHAFLEANAFYSKDARSLLFGYFPATRPSGRAGPTVFTSLSHDVLAHETSHALLDGLRSRYTDPSSLDQAAFHEAFADLVALLSVFSMRSVVEALLANGRSRAVLRESDFDGAWLKSSPLFAMAEQLGHELNDTSQRKALRASLLLEPRTDYLRTAEFQEEHRRAEVLVAATMYAFVAMWKTALWGRSDQPKRAVPIDVVVTEGCDLADRLLTMVIRAIDYAPVVDIQFGDFLTALVTADEQLVGRDEKYRARETLVAHFKAFGISPEGGQNALWDPPDKPVDYDHIHPDTLRHDPDEVFRFLWENRTALSIDEQAYTKVLSVRPCTRKGPDGFWLQETVCEYVQLLTVRADEVASINLLDKKGRKVDRLIRPAGLRDSDEVTLNGGGVLLFDEYAKLKFHVQSRVRSGRQQARLAALADAGQLLAKRAGVRSFADMHAARASLGSGRTQEGW